MYALVDINGKQYKAIKGNSIRIDRVPQEKGAGLEFRSVLLISDNDQVKIGTPYVDGVSVKASVEDHGRADKVIVFKYKKRKRERKKKGHRQPFSVIKIEDITGI